LEEKIPFKIHKIIQIPNEIFQLHQFQLKSQHTTRKRPAVMKKEMQYIITIIKDQ
jgi:phage-related protein